ncbi:MAG: hypothetical protein ABIJ36_03205 [Patescibacteria group bacterium]|nr:hypothetical protein [Patescibacteria group bacterium]
MIKLASLSVSDRKTISSFFMVVSIVCIAFAVVGAFFVDVVLASTQWILLAILFAVWGIYLKLELKA